MAGTGGGCVAGTVGVRVVVAVAVVGGAVVAVAVVDSVAGAGAGSGREHGKQIAQTEPQCQCQRKTPAAACDMGLREAGALPPPYLVHAARFKESPACMHACWFAIHHMPAWLARRTSMRYR